MSNALVLDYPVDSKYNEEDLKNLDFYVNFIEKLAASANTTKNGTAQQDKIISDMVGCYARVTLIAQKNNIDLKLRYPQAADLFTVLNMFFKI